MPLLRRELVGIANAYWHVLDANHRGCNASNDIYFHLDKLLFSNTAVYCIVPANYCFQFFLRPYTAPNTTIPPIFNPLKCTITSLILYLYNLHTAYTKHV